MRTLEKVEIVLVVAVAGAAAALKDFLPVRLAWGEISIYASAFVLAQSLVRDLWLKYGAPKPPPPPEGTVPQRNLMCVESTIGIVGIAAGIGAFAGWPSWGVALPAWFWPAFAFAVGMFGFLAKDYVLDWRNGKILMEKDHHNIVWW